jgi:hypothetical protein
MFRDALTSNDAGPQPSRVTRRMGGEDRDSRRRTAGTQRVLQARAVGGSAVTTSETRD